MLHKSVLRLYLTVILEIHIPITIDGEGRDDRFSLWEEPCKGFIGVSYVISALFILILEATTPPANEKTMTQSDHHSGISISCEMIIFMPTKAKITTRP